MKKPYVYLLFTVAFAFAGCETEVDVDLNNADPILVVDAWLTHTPGQQQIVLTYTRPYFDNSAAAGVKNAQVTVVDAEDPGNPFVFIESTTEGESGVYIWTPANPADSFGVIGHTYLLEVITGGKRFYSQSSLNPVPAIDSVTFRFEDGTGEFFPDSYFAEFWARDLLGEGDTYWIKTWKNGMYLNKPSEILLAYDAGFSQGGAVDNLIFIQPIREGINPFDQDEDDNFYPPYEGSDTFRIKNDSIVFRDGNIGYVKQDTLIVNDTTVREDTQYRLLDGNPYYVYNDTTLVRQGDSIYVEIQAISNDVWFFLVNVAEETNRPGGFGELFSTPLANVYTNIIPENEEDKAVGIFSVASKSGLGRRLTLRAIREEASE